MKKITTGSKKVAADKVTAASGRMREFNLSRLEKGLRQVLNTLDSMDDETFHEVEVILGRNFYRTVLDATQDISESH